MNRQQRRAAERGRSPKLPAYQLNKRQQPQSTTACFQERKHRKKPSE